MALTMTPRVRSIVFRQVLPSAMMIVVFLALYALTLLVPPGRATFWISVPAIAIIWFTAVARLNDIDDTRGGWRWHCRRFGFVLAAMASFAAIYQVSLDYNTYPTWGDLLFRWGVAITWLTTPHMPPWWKYIAGKDVRDFVEKD